MVLRMAQLAWLESGLFSTVNIWMLRRVYMCLFVRVFVHV